MGRESRLHALKRLLDYALAESEELGSAVLGKLLAAAALAVSEELGNVELDDVKALPPRPDASC